MERGNYRNYYKGHMDQIIGEGVREGAERFSGTTIKDTWTKSRERVEVGEGGGFG